MVSKLRAVRGQRQFLKRPALQMTTDPPHQLAKIAPHERLPAAQANFPDAARNETVCNDGDFLQRKNLVTREEGHFRSEEHTSELQSLMRISYAVFCLKKKTTLQKDRSINTNIEQE